LSGFFEPQGGDMDENMFFDEGEDESEEEEAGEGVNGKVSQNLRQAKQNALKNSTVAARGGDDEDEDDEEDLDFDEDEEEDEDEEDDDTIILQK
jgi:hypothetical protein